jgi:Ca2+-binding RTX toxin-like protein
VLCVRGDNAVEVELSTNGQQLEVTIDSAAPQRFDVAAVRKIVVQARGGDDVILVDADVTIAACINGGSGDDAITAGGADTTLRGGSGNDSLTGGDGDDMLRGRGGEDTIDGVDGNDMLTGGRGDDSLAGEHGDDRIRAVRGSDSVNGGTGDDTINCRGNRRAIVQSDAHDTMKHCGAEAALRGLGRREFLRSRR